jgi:hypothetical protein
MARNIVKKAASGRKIIQKSGENAPKSSGRKVISRAKKYLYCHTWGQDSVRNHALHVKISRLGLPIEFATSPCGYKSYRISVDRVDDLYHLPGDNRYYMPIKGDPKALAMQEEDRFWYLHLTWAPLEPE